MSSASDFIIENGVLKKYVGPGGDVVIPDGVTSIESHAFFGCRSLTCVTISDGVTSIGRYAFCGCSGLRSVMIPEGLTNIGDEAFRDCKGLADNDGFIENHLIKAKPALSGEYSIKEGTRSIAGGAFECCEKLTGVVLPDGVQTIGINAFSGCINLNTVYIPESVTEIFKSEGYGRFNFGSFIDCPKLTIHAPTGSYAEQYAKENNIPFVAE